MSLALSVFLVRPMPPVRRPAGRALLPAFLLITAGVAACTQGDAHQASPAAEGERIRAVTLDAIRPPSDATLARLADLGVTHLAVIPFAFQPALDVPELRMNRDGRWFSESDTGIRALAEQAGAHGIRLILKPQLWLRGGWSADVAFEQEADWQAWETQYREFILHYARLAEEVEAPLLVVGTELAGSVRARPAYWRGLIADVRSIYGGALTYAANWHEDYEHVPFWDALDYVGVQAYFPLTEEADPTLEVLQAAWVPHVAQLRGVHERTGKPVLFTEFGYRSVPYAAAEPWRWPSRDEHETVAPDDALQARLYEAFFASVWQQPWCAGAVVWKWYPEPIERRRPADLDFTPQGKAAEDVLGRWYGERG